MIEKGNIHSVVGLPDKLFLNTDIPVAVIIFGKTPSNKILFIDGSKDCEKNSKQNRLRKQDINKILYTLSNRLEVKKYSHIADMEEISNNDYNLNISRYVDTYEPPPPVDIVAVTKELFECSQQIKRLEAEIYASFSELTAQDEKTKQELEEARKIFGEMIALK